MDESRRVDDGHGKSSSKNASYLLLCVRGHALSSADVIERSI